MTWLQDDKRGPTLDKAGKARALPFALISKDVYQSPAGAVPSGTLRLGSWTSVLADPEIKSRLTRMDQLEVALGPLLGFNAALYALNGLHDQATVVAFEGSGLSFANATAAQRTLETWLGANASATADRINKLGEPVIDRVMKLLFGRSVFASGLNVRGSPSTAYDLADLLAREVSRLHGATTILTGHSLGGGLAQYGANRNGLRAVGFNSSGAGVTVPGPDAAEAIVRIDTSGDFVNDIVTQWSDVASRHLGTRYVVGKGGHAIDDVIKALESD